MGVDHHRMGTEALVPATPEDPTGPRTTTSASRLTVPIRQPGLLGRVAGCTPADACQRGSSAAPNSAQIPGP